MDQRFTIRKANVTDAKGIAKVHVDSWKSTYANIVPAEYLNNLSYESREQMWTNAIPYGGVYVAESNDGRIVGFSKGGKERSGTYIGFDGEIYAIYILKEYQGKGIGTALVKPIIAEMNGMGINTMLVFVLEDNISRQFYESLGGKKIDTVEVEIGGKKLSELVYGWGNIRNIL
ncbi:GNAT family N-acetyltransferase [Cytobacillus sp.]|uniref:GNAT family N-acetyltransferase n=1 Tax=Cytobacillus sp. TaxID=2675269 RepID=UPI0028BD2BDB|nr:GNAT family N-acetyltransferase [Cytobacillus sp.]